MQLYNYCLLQKTHQSIPSNTMQICKNYGIFQLFVFFWRNLTLLAPIVLYIVSLKLPAAYGWTYHYSNESMVYEQARVHCQAHYTDLVAIQNKREIEHLEQHIPSDGMYYWIGIRKINEVWTWVGTNKTLTPEAENWALGEPNNKGTREDCVEIYIRKGNNVGKWNDDSCRKKKRALCYTASCNNTLCGSNGECVEIINNYTCDCHEGFYGNHCQHVVQCPSLLAPSQGFLNCSHPWEDFSFQSNCKFSCSDGFLLSGFAQSECLSSGAWSNESPNCTVVQCPSLLAPSQGFLNCSHPWGEFSFQSNCKFSCSDGFLLSGSVESECLSSGAWSNASSNCTAMRCDELNKPNNSSMTCHHPWTENSFGSICEFSCPEGWRIKGSNVTECGGNGQWTEATPVCEEIRCEPLEAPDHGYLNCSHPTGDFSIGTVCQFGCDDEFIIRIPNKTVCLESGQWTTNAIQCEAKQNIRNNPY
ncbi:L-selectin isoform 2-T2 [Discoglossus pictus]